MADVEAVCSEFSVVVPVSIDDFAAELAVIGSVPADDVEDSGDDDVTVFAALVFGAAVVLLLPLDIIFAFIRWIPVSYF